MAHTSYLEAHTDIEKQIAKLQKEKEALTNRHRTTAITSIVKSIREYDITIEEIQNALATKTAKQGKLSTLAPKYRHPSGETWSGRGRPPLWIVTAEQSGQSRDKFLIPEEVTSSETDNTGNTQT